jgi:hypothetical protein
MQEHRQAGNDAHGDHIDAQAGNDALGDHIDAPADNDAHGQHGAMSPNINGLDHYEDWDGVVHRGHGTLIADNANQMA